MIIKCQQMEVRNKRERHKKGDEPEEAEEERRVKPRKEDNAENPENKNEPSEPVIGMLKRLQESSKKIENILGELNKVDIAEVFSPPRVCAEAARFKLKIGKSMDLTTGWNFNLKAHREAAEQYIDKEEPFLLIGSPVCTMFSQLQALSEWTVDKEAKYQESVEHL